jgi:excisionase family DNA binding protein
MQSNQINFSVINPEDLQSLIKQTIQEAISSNKPKQCSQPQTDEILTVNEAALFLKVTKPTIYDAVSKGKLPVYKPLKQCYFFKAELIDFVRRSKKKTNAEIDSETDAYLLTNIKKK